MEPRKFDVIEFDVGDIVIRKNKTDNPSKQEVVKTEILNNLDNFSYQILYFKGNEKEPFVAWEFEPFDMEERAEYHRILNDVGVKPKVVKENKSKSKVKVLTVKMKKDETT